MGWFKDVPMTPHPDLNDVRFAKAGSPSDWTRTRHRWLSAIYLAVGLYIGAHFSAAFTTTAATKPCPTPSPPAQTQTTVPRTAVTSDSSSIGGHQVSIPLE
jgi:hypothetical protein